MGLILKQSTAINLIVGPFIDEDDGKTVEGALVITQPDVRLSKNGGNMAQKNEATALVHDEIGYYLCLLDGTDTNTLGRLQLMIHEAGALPVYHEFMVVTANVYDTQCGADLFQTDLTQMGGVAQSATDLKDFADAGYDPAVDKVNGVKLVDTTTTNTDLVSAANVRDAILDDAPRFSGADIASILTDTGAIAWADITAIIADIGVFPTANYATIAAYVENIRTRLIAIDADTDELQTDWTNGGRLDNLLDAVAVEAGGNLATVLADTNELQTDWVNGGRLDLIVDAILADTNELQTDWVNGGRLDLLLDAIKAVTDLLILADIADVVLDEVVEGAITLRQSIRLMNAMNAGKSSGGGTATLIYRDYGDARNRITFTADAVGNRTVVVRDLA